MKRRRFEVAPGPPGRTLARALAAALALPTDEAQRLIRAGAVYLRGRRSMDPSTGVREGDPVLVVLEESGKKATEAVVRPAVRVLYEDEGVVAVDKPAGVTTQPTPGRVGASLLDAVSAWLGRPAGLVHRLDKDTTGVVVFGKTRAATSALAQHFRDRAAQKVYLALAGPALPERGVLDIPLAKDPSRPGRYRGLHGGHGVPAITEFERLGGSAFSVVALRPQTGRTHQLRAHLASAGAPILGDVLYGGAKQAGGRGVGRCLLHAWTLSLPQPGLTHLEAPVPEDMARFIAEAGVVLGPALTPRR